MELADDPLIEELTAEFKRMSTTFRPMGKIVTSRSFIAVISTNEYPLEAFEELT